MIEWQEGSGPYLIDWCQVCVALDGKAMKVPVEILEGLKVFFISVAVIKSAT